MSGGGGGSKNTTTTQKTEPWSGVQPFLTQGFEELSSLYGTPQYDKKGKQINWTLGQGPQYYPGQTTVTPNALEGIGQNQQLAMMNPAYALAGQGQGMIGTLGGAAGQTGVGGQYGLQSAADQIGSGTTLRDVGFNLGANPAMQKLLAAGDPSSNPYFQSALQSAIRPVQQQFQEQVLPGIRQGAIGAGQMGSSRQGVAEGIASRGYMDTVGDIAANMGNQAYGQGLQAMQAAGQLGSGLTGLGQQSIAQGGQLGSQLYGQGLDSAARGAALAPQIQQMGFLPGQVAEQIGQQRTADAQAQTDDDIRRFEYGQNLPFSMMSDYLNMLQGGAGLGGLTSQQASGGGGSLLGRVGGGALTGAGLLAGAGPAAMPWGALGGGLLGLFG